MKLTLTKSLAVLAMVISLGACQNLDKKQQNTAVGAAVGGVAGNLIFGGGWCNSWWCRTWWRNW